ncbi:MAG: molybdopterin-dependent oxidoreductase [Myxococcota bacterium]
METTYCRICEAACGLTAEIQDGEVVKLRPDREHPVSRGYACAKGTRFHEAARHGDRLHTPELFGRPTSWTNAIGTAAARIAAIRREHGPHSVGVYFGNPMAFNALGLVSTIALNKALGSRNIFYAGTQDCSNKFAGAKLVYGSPLVHPIADFAHADLAIVLGSNPYVSQSSFIHLEGGGPAVFGDLLGRGGDVVWVDPRRTESARKWGTHLAIVPGTDAWLLLALIQHLAGHHRPHPPRVEGLAEVIAAARSVDLQVAGDRTGLGTDAIAALAQRIADSPRTAFHMSVGVNQGGFGTLCYVLLQALACITGNLDRRGGLVFNPTAGAFDKLHRWARLENDFRSRVGDFRSLLGTLPGGVLADEILEPGDGQIRAMIVLAGDPLRSIPGSSRLRKAFESLELLSCVDMFRSRTATMADVVLPSASWLERWDLATSTIPFQQAPLMQMSGPLVPPPGQARTDARIIADLAIALGLPGPWRLGRLPWDRLLPSPKFGLPVPGVRPGRALRRRTVHLWGAPLDAELRRLHATPVKARGFSLLCRRRRLAHNSWLHGGTRDGASESAVWMRSDDMATAGVRAGDVVSLQTAEGRIRLPVTPHDELPPRCVVVPHGLPDVDVNALIPAGAEHVERLSGQLRMTGIDVDVAPAGC